MRLAEESSKSLSRSELWPDVQAPGAGPQCSYPGALDSNFQSLQKGAGTVLIFKPQESVAFCYDSLRRLI